MTNQFFSFILLHQQTEDFQDLILDSFNLFIQSHKPGIHVVKPGVNPLEITNTKIMEAPLIFSKAIKPIHHESFKRRHGWHSFSSAAVGPAS